MRKLEKKNILFFNLFGALVVLTVIGLSVAVVQVVRNGNDVYAVPVGSIVYDEQDSLVDTSEDGNISRRWDKKYYLSAGDGNNYCLGKDAVIYDPSSSQLKIYGDGYQVFYDGTVEQFEGETEIADVNNSALYKLDDRRYLMTGSLVSSLEGTFQSRAYMVVHIDRTGNALLRGMDLNRKTISPIVLTSNDLYFDVASELLYYDGSEINLKKIMGSTNEYKGQPILYADTGLTRPTGEGQPNEEANAPQNLTVIAGNGGSGGAGGKGGIGGTGGTGGYGGIGGDGGIGGTGGRGGTGGYGADGGHGGTGGSGGTGGDGGNTAITNPESSKGIAMTGVEAEATSIKVDYVVSDPAGDYGMVMIRLKDHVGAVLRSISLDKASTSATIYELSPNTRYKVELVYREYVVENGAYVLSEPIISDTQVVKTETLNIELATAKISATTAYVSVKLNGLSIDQGTVILQLKNELGHATAYYTYDFTAATIQQASSDEGWIIPIDIEDGDVELEGRVENVAYKNTPLSVSAKYYVNLLKYK